MRAVLTRSRTALTLLALTLTKGGTKNIHIINFISGWRVLYGGDVLCGTRAVDDDDGACDVWKSIKFCQKRENFQAIPFRSVWT